MEALYTGVRKFSIYTAVAIEKIRATAITIQKFLASILRMQTGEIYERFSFSEFIFSLRAYFTATASAVVPVTPESV